MPLSTLLENFCQLTKNQKQKTNLGEYQAQLHEAYLAGERIIRLPASVYGLQQTGGVLLQVFLMQHPDIEEIHLAGNMLNEAQGTQIKNGAGFDAILIGLSQTRVAGKLRILDLSQAVYSLEQFARLAQEVLMDHPTLKILKLDNTFLTDEHLRVMLPYLSCPHLKTLSLRNNRLQGSVFEDFVDSILRRCPALQFLDLTANASIPLNSPGTRALKQLVTQNKNCFVRLPQDKELLNLSLKNHYEYFMPSHLSMMEAQFRALSEQFERFEIRLNSLPELPPDAAKRLQALEGHAKETQQKLIEHTDTIAKQLIRQALMDRQLKGLSTEVVDLRVIVKSTEMYVSDLGERVTAVEQTAGDVRDQVLILNQTISAQADSMDAINELVNHALEISQALERQWNDQQVSESSALDDTIASQFSSEHTVYIKKFKQALIQMYTVAMVTAKGAVPLNISGNLGKTSKALLMLADCAPWGSSAGIKIISYLLQTADDARMQRRMERLTQLGSEPAEVAELAIYLGRRLIHCLTLENHVTENRLGQLLSMTSDMLQNGFYGALCVVLQKEITTIVDQTMVMDVSTIGQRAEQDAQLLLTAVAEEGMPELLEGAQITNRLFLYAAPTFTMTDYLFVAILQRFCQSSHNLTPENLHFNTLKREKFYNIIAQSWHRQADAVAERFENADTRMVFIRGLADGFHFQQHDDDTQGVFYFKTSHTTLFSLQSSKRHVSWHSKALQPKTADHVLQTILR